ncbi:MAG: response regulator, partial [Phycisphaeraceae bacterium]|nr:response regulator [Phycisphaeraceae bacterium]
TQLRGAELLLVEDNQINRIVAGEILEAAGATVTTAETGVQAVKLAQSRPFDLIVMDCQMPEMDGFEATRRIRQHERETGRPRTPIIALTANAIKGDRERCLDAGMDDYATKPINPDELVAKLCRSRGMHTGPAEAPPSPRDEPSQVPLDHAALLHRCMNQPRVLLRTLEAFERQAETTMASVQEAAAKLDMDSLAKLAHGVKGAAANLSAEPLRDAALDVETLARNHRELELNAAIAILQTRMDQCLAYLPTARQACRPDAAEPATPPTQKEAHAHPRG